MYWRMNIWSCTGIAAYLDKTILFNRPDITFMNKKTKNTFLIDTAVPNTHNLAKAITDKQNKYQELANEIWAMLKQKAAQVIAIVISSTGVIPKSLSQSLTRVNLHPNTYILTYLLTYSMVQSPSWEANWFAASQEILRISRNPKVHYRTHKRPPPVSILASPIQSIYPHPTSWRSVLILSPHLRLGLPSGLLPSGFPTKTLYTPLTTPIRAIYRSKNL